jgi:hypothetical protein
MGFSQIQTITTSPAYTTIIASIRRLIIALDATEHAGTTAAYLPELVALRNWTQHCLLSLPSSASNPSRDLSPPTKGPNTCTCTLELVRVSLLILSTFIVFPVPSSAHGLNVSLNRALLEALECCIGRALDSLSIGSETSSDDAKMRLVVWACMLGAINCQCPTSSVTAPTESASLSVNAQRRRFAILLADAYGCLHAAQAPRFKVSRHISWSSGTGDGDKTGQEEMEGEWMRVKDVLGSFLWSEVVLEGMAREAWQDAWWLRRMESSGAVTVPEPDQ